MPVAERISQAPISLELNKLDAYLHSASAPRNSMMLSELDGFLTAIAIGPDEIAPAEWLPYVWDREAPFFADASEQRAILDAIMGRYDEIIEEISQAALRPIFWSDADGTIVAKDWAAGFGHGIALRPHKWEKLSKTPAGELLLPILLVSGDMRIRELLDLSESEMTEASKAATETIPIAVMTIAVYWRMAAADVAVQRPYLRAGTKTGRNDPCPCGSGRKFKKCCAGSRS